MARGRPRQFDPDEVLDKALAVFWRRGFQGTSLDDLTAAMGISRPSLYATYGNKEALFRQVLERYGEKMGRKCFCVFGSDRPIAEALRAMLERYVATLCDDSTPPSCLVAGSAFEREAMTEELAEAVREASARTEEALVRRFQEAVEAGERLPGDETPAIVARSIHALMVGLAFLASQGADEENLRRVLAIQLQPWETAT